MRRHIALYQGGSRSGGLDASPQTGFVSEVLLASLSRKDAQRRRARDRNVIDNGDKDGPLRWDASPSKRDDSVSGSYRSPRWPAARWKRQVEQIASDMEEFIGAYRTMTTPENQAYSSSTKKS